MKLTTLMENTACVPGLTAEHGLSLFVEAAGRTFLFDAGQSGAFADNAARLGVDLSAAEFAILSHGHYDHGGGMHRFLQENDQAPVYASRHCFDDCRNASGKYIGLDSALRDCPRLILTGDEHPIGPGLTLFSCSDLPHRADPFGLTRMEQGVLRPDDFRHEQYLLIEEAGTRILLTGCSHKGVVQLTERFRPDILVGGFHFKSLDPADPRLRTFGEALARFDCTYYTGHCTGESQFSVLKTILGSRLEAISTGFVLEIPQTTV